MHVACPCGQEFTLHGEQFPRRIRCHACGRRVSVMDDGEIIDPDMASLARPIPDPAAIQAGPGWASGPPPPNSVCAQETHDTLNLAKPDALSTVSNKELALVDLLWETERRTYSMIPFFGLEIMPTKMLSGVIALVALISWGVIGALTAQLTSPAWWCPLTLGAAIATILPVHIYKKAHEYERAVSEWQRKRVIAIASADQRRVNA